MDEVEELEQEDLLQELFIKYAWVSDMLEDTEDDLTEEGRAV